MGYLVDRVNQFKKDRQLYVWGAWKRCSCIINEIEASGTIVCGIIDSKKRGIYCGKNIYTPEEIMAETNKNVCIVVTLEYFDNVCDQLENAGFAENKDFLYVGSSVTVSECTTYYDWTENRISGKLKNHSVKLALRGEYVEYGNVFFDENTRIDVEGFAKVSIFEDVKIGKNVNIFCLDDSEIIIENGVVVKDNATLICKNGSKIVLCKGSVVGENTTVRCLDESLFEHGEESKLEEFCFLECKGKSKYKSQSNTKINKYGRVYVWNDGTIELGKKSTFGQHLDLRAGNGTKFVCGIDCMISYRVCMRSYNGHTVIDLDKKERYNTKKNVILGNHVWIGLNSIVMAGTSIGDGSIVGAGSFVNHSFKNNQLIVGTPAYTMREKVDWDRRQEVEFEEWEENTEIYN